MQVSLQRSVIMMVTKLAKIVPGRDGSHKKMQQNPHYRILLHLYVIFQGNFYSFFFSRVSILKMYQMGQVPVSAVRARMIARMMKISPRIFALMTK